MHKVPWPRAFFLHSGLLRAKPLDVLQGRKESKKDAQEVNSSQMLVFGQCKLSARAVASNKAALFFDERFLCLVASQTARKERQGQTFITNKVPESRPGSGPTISGVGCV